MLGRPILPLEKIHAFKNLSFSDDELKAVKIVLAVWKDNIKTVRKHISKLKMNDVPFDDLEDRIAKIVNLGKDSSSLRSLQLRYGDEVGAKIFRTKNVQCRVTRDRLENKLGLVGADCLLKSRGASLENYVKRHGQEAGTQKWNEYCAKRAAAYVRRHQDGYQFAKYTERYYINLHGEEKGRQVWAERELKRAYMGSKQRYIDEYGAFGEEICRKIKTTVSRECFLRRYGAEAGNVQYELYLDKKAQSRTYSFQSKAANNYFTIMVETLGFEVEECRFGTGREKILYLTSEERLILPQRIIAVDFMRNNRIIEYNGDAVHANPAIYQENDTPHPWDKTVLAGQIWQRDAAKNRIIKERGFDLLVLWESEAFKHVEETLELCKRFLEGDNNDIL